MRIFPEVVFQSLESRRLLSATTPATALTLADRQALLADWTGSDKSTLKSDLASDDVNKFDTDLLNYVTGTSGALGNFFFSPSNVNNYISFIQANSSLNTSDVTTIANDVVNHIFPDTNGNYDVQLPAGDVNWLTVTATSGTEDLHELNRMDFSQDLAMTYRLTGNSSYATELLDEMASWAVQNPPLANPNTYLDHQPSWYLLDTSQRADNWVWSYELMVGSPAWTPAANTLFLYEMDLHGKFLDGATPPVIADNRTVQQAHSLLEIGQIFPEFADSAKWVADGRSLLFTSMDAQIYSDGSDREQSPGYADEILTDLMEQQMLDSINGYTWPASQLDRLKKGFKAFAQQLTPDGNRSAQGDSDRSPEQMLLSEADLAGIESFPVAKPRLLDVWLFGPGIAGNDMSDPVYPALPDRGLTYELPISGNYIMRSNDDSSNGIQVTFNDGPKGGGHGHLDYLNFELYGYGKALIADTGPWTYDTSPERDWVESSTSSNAVSVDNTSAGPLDGTDNPDIQLDQWDVGENSVQVTASYEGYGALEGSPELARSIWYDYGGTMLVVDWTWSSESHAYTVGFNLDSSATMNGNGSIQTNDSSGNVAITPLLLAGQSASASSTITYGGSTFDAFANFNDEDNEDPAERYSITQTATDAVFGELITAYSGTSAPDVTAAWASPPQPGQPVQINLTQNGQMQTITFTPPTVTLPGRTGAVDSQYTAIAYAPNGDLDMAFYDPIDQLLEYTQRGPSGLWSPVQVVDSEIGAGINPSIAVDSSGDIGIAYTDGNGELKYAEFSGGTWGIVQVTGLAAEDPSLAFSRDNGAAISFFSPAKHSLELDIQADVGFDLTRVDSDGKVGLHSVLMLDPSRPTASKWAIAYQDSTNHTIKYAVQYKSGWDIETVGKATGSGQIGMTFNSQSEPMVSYFSAATGDVYVATDSGSFGEGGNWSLETVSAAGLGGSNNNLFFDDAGRLDVVYTDDAQHHIVEAVLSGGKWARTTLATDGARAVNSTESGKHFAFTNLVGSTSTVTLEDS
jgi:hypothetical protein